MSLLCGGLYEVISPSSGLLIVCPTLVLPLYVMMILGGCFCILKDWRNKYIKHGTFSLDVYPVIEMLPF